MVKAGYKQTEARIIPKDWEVGVLSDVVDFLDGQRKPIKASERAKMRGIYPYYGASGIVDYVNDYLFDDHLILLGEDGENILSRNTRLAFQVTGKIWVNNHAHVLKVKVGNDTGFITEYLESLDYSQYNSGTAQPKLNKKTCKNIPIAKPSYQEQQVIAEALSDVDGLIAVLDKLIAKKRAIKTATMQQLLTGKKRLPGFGGNGRWEDRQLGDIANITMGQSPSSSFYNDKGNGLPLIQGNADVKNRKAIIRNYTSQITKRCQKGDIILSVRAPVGEVAKTDFDACIGRGVCAISYPNEFLYHYLIYLEPQWSRLSKGSTFDSVNSDEVRALEIHLPKSVEEQLAITQILSDMDTEIAALEARRAKTQAIKQGMMQELLTGRTRLL